MKIDYDNKVGMIHTAKDGLLSAALNIAEPGPRSRYLDVKLGGLLQARIIIDNEEARPDPA